MKLGDFTFKRRYSLAQVIVDIASVIAFLSIIFVIYACAMDIEMAKSLNSTGESLSFLNWRPLIIWAVLGLVVCILSVIALFIPRKMPKKRTVTEGYAPKYCNIIDTCISCLRLIILLAISELCYIHMRTIMLQENSFSIQLVLHVIIAALIIWFTAVRLDSISQAASEELPEKKKREIIEN